MIGYKRKDEFFKLPTEIMCMELNPYELAIYSYIVYLTRKNEKQISCHPSLKKIGNTIGINKNTVLKYVRSLENKELIRTYPTKVFTKRGKVQNGNLRYVLLPIETAFRIYREEKFKKAQKELAKIRFQNAIKNGKKTEKTG